MTVVNPKSISGINSITTGSGSDDILTIHTNNGTERLRVDSTGATKIVTGIVTTLTATTGIVTTLTTNTLTANSTTKVGSGVTLSPDGDVFFTGIATGNGSGLTALNASNISSGTVPTARLGSGTASSSTFLRGDSTFQTVNTDLVSDTSPQLGGDLDTNDFEILLDDNHAVKFGAGVDLELKSNGINGIVHSPTGHLRLQTTGSDKNVVLENASTGEYYGIFKANGAAELYHDGTKQCETSASGLAFPAGKGIDFSAQAHGTAASGVTVNSELLDHYEEGTFSPLLKRLMTNGVTETNFYNQGTRQGNYLILGNRIWITGRIHWNGGSTGSGSLILTNLPYTPASGGANEVPITVGYRTGFNYANITGYLVQSTNRVHIQYFDTNATYNIAPSATASSGHFYFAMNYQI